MVRGLVLESKSETMDRSMKVIGLKTWLAALGGLFMLMAMYISGIGRRIKPTAMGNINTWTEQSISEPGKTTSSTARVQRHGPMEPSTKAST